MKRPVPTRIVVACLTLLAGTSVAHAGENDVFTPYVGYGVASDDNVSRAPDDGDRVSDTWTTKTFGLRVDKTISRQRLTADVSINDTKYDHFRQYDNEGRNLQGNWGWALGNNFSGNLGASRSEGLTPFSDSATPLRSVVTQKRTYVDGEWRFHPSWRADASFSRTEVDYDLFEPANLRLNTAEIGFGYTPKSGNVAGVLLRHSTGEYPSGSGDYTQDEAKANIRWQVTGKTNMQFLGGFARRDFDDPGNKNYSGFDARLTTTWAATGKTSFVLAAYRELGSGVGRDPATNAAVNPDPTSPDDYFANFSQNTGLSLSANWQATAKLKVDASIQSEKRNYNGVGNALFPGDRSDRYRKNTIGVTFLPFRQLNIRASVYQQRLDSNAAFAIADYRTKGFQLNARYEF